MTKKIKNKIIILSISLVFLILGYIDWKALGEQHSFWKIFYYVSPSWVALIICGFPIAKKAIKMLMKKQIKMPFLVLIAFIASIALEITSFFIHIEGEHGHGHSYIFAAAEIGFFMTLGGLIESLTVAKCKSGIKRLVNLIPKTAFLIKDGNIEKTSLENINIGDIVLCKSGEMIAVDGVVTEGRCSVDQSSVTGEFLPKDITVDDIVYAGTMNVNGTIQIRVTKLLKDMTIAKMAELVKEAEGKKTPIARIADKWVSVIVPSILILSMIIGLLSNYVLHAGAVQSILRAVTVLVVFCPCAFVLATPTAMAAGLGNAAKNGVLIKSGKSLEELSRIDTVCFDKTGTLTEGKIVLSDIIPIDITEKELLQYAASLEKYSEHPLSKAVIDYVEKGELYDSSDIVTTAGVGISGIVNGFQVAVYSYQYTVKNNNALNQEIQEKISLYFSQGKTVSFVFINDSLKGVFAFADKLRANCKEVVSSINGRGYRTIMLTGDNKSSAQFIADSVGISEVHSELLPEDKLRIIEKLQAEGRKVCMVGDGINDAPSMKTAAISVAMEAIGSDIAMETADMAILNSNLEKLDYTLKLGKRVMRTIMRNIIVAMMINFVSVFLTLFGHINPVLGAIIHNGTSLFVVLSSVLLLHTPKKKISNK